MRRAKNSAAALMLSLAGLAIWGAAKADMDIMAGLPDPTRPDIRGGSSQQQGMPLILESTLVSGARKSAVINGKLITIGSHIRGARVVEISPDAVILQRHSRHITLHLQKKNIVRREQETKP